MAHQFSAEVIIVAYRESVGIGTFLPRSGSFQSTSNTAETYPSQPIHHLHLPGFFIKIPHIN